MDIVQTLQIVGRTNILSTAFLGKAPQNKIHGRSETDN